MQTESATGSVSVNKVRTTLTIKIEAIDFDTQGCVLRLKGRNIQENQYVKVLLFMVQSVLPGIIHFSLRQYFLINMMRLFSTKVKVNIKGLQV